MIAIVWENPNCSNYAGRNQTVWWFGRFNNVFGPL